MLSSVGVRLPLDNIPVTTGVLSESIPMINLSSAGEYSLAKPWPTSNVKFLNTPSEESNTSICASDLVATSKSVNSSIDNVSLAVVTGVPSTIFLMKVCWPTVTLTDTSYYLT